MYIPDVSSFSTAAKISNLSVPVFIVTASHFNATFVLLPPDFVSYYSNIPRLLVLVDVLASSMYSFSVDVCIMISGRTVQMRKSSAL